MNPRLAALIAVSLWGVSFVATKVALRDVSPATLVVTRFAMGVALLLGLLALRRELKVPPRAHWGTLALMGFLGVFVHQMLQANALTLTTAQNTGWLIGVTPLCSALVAWVALREKPGAAQAAGLAVGFAGACLVVAGGTGGFGVPDPRARTGDLLVLLSTLNWAVYTVLGRRALESLGSLTATAFSMLAGWSLLLPLFVAQAGWRELPSLTATGWGAVLFLGVGCSGAGYLLWYRALERETAAVVSAFLYLEPLVALAAALALLGERLSPLSVAGGLIVLGGVALAQRRN